MNKTAVVVLHYKGEEETRECLSSLLKSNPVTDEFQIIVVVNEAKENFTKSLARDFPPINLIINKENLGFARGNNLGIKKALELNCQNIILTNNDTIVACDLISRLVRFAKESPNTGLISPKIYFAKGFEYHKGRYKEKEKGKVVWYAGGILDWANIYGRHRGVNEIDNGQYDQICETDFVTGCCMLIKKEVVEKIGFFDEKYFLYFEDVDYSVRAKNAGFKVIYYPKAYLWHKNAASSGKPGSPLHIYYQTRNRLYFGFKYALFWVKKSLFLESLKMIYKDGIKRYACFDYYLGRMGRRVL